MNKITIFIASFFIVTVGVLPADNQDWESDQQISVGFNDPNYVEIKKIEDAVYGKINIIKESDSAFTIAASITWEVKKPLSTKDTVFFWNGKGIGSGNAGLNEILARIDKLKKGTVVSIPFMAQYANYALGWSRPFDPFRIKFRSEFLQKAQKNKVVIIMIDNIKE